MAINNHRIFLYKPEAASVTADNAGPYLLGELIVDNLNVSIKLQEISTVTFTVPRIINNTANTRIDEVFDSYIIELWYGDLSGTLGTDYYKYRFTLYSTPINFSDNKIIHSYTGYSLEALTELKMLVSWPGIEISDFYRKISYNNTTATPKFLEPKDTVTTGNFEYTITTGGSGADYITVVPTTAVATDIDIFIYEVRQRLSSGNVVSESEAGLIPYSGTGPNDAGFKAGYYFLTISGGYVTQINIALPDNYTSFNGESVSSQLLFFKLYDNPLSRRYAIGITTNAEQANDMYIDLAHDVAEGQPTDYDDFNFQTQKFYSKNGLTLKQVLLGKENTTVNSVTEDGLLYSTGFTLGTIDASLDAKYRSNLEFNNTSRYAAIKTLAESFDAIAVYDTVNNTVSFYPENIYGVNNGLIIRYGAYLKALNKEIDASKIITNAIGLGKDNLTISLVNPTGENYWEDYSYYLDDYYIESSSEIGAITEDASLGITFNYVSTSGYQSRWMSSTLAAKVAKWQYTRDWFHSILTGEYNASGFTSTITQFYNFYENRLEAIRNLIKKETQYYTALKKEVKYEAFKNYYDKLSKDNPSNATYATKLSYYTGQLLTAKTANAALLVIIDAARKAIFDENTAGSYAAKMVVLRGFLQKDSVARDINLDNLRPFQRETVVNDSSIDDEKDLLEIVKTHVDENKEPKVTISIDIASILAAQEAQEDWKKVKVGDKINIYLDELNVDVVAQIREINVDFEQHSLSFVISTVRNYNKGFGNFVLKTIRNLYNSNNNNVQYEIDGNRYSIETAGNVNSVLENGFNTADTSVNSGLEDDNGNPSTTTGGAGTVTSSIGSVDDLTESVSSYVSTDTQGVIIADGRVLAYHNYTSPTTYSSEIEMSAETGFTIRKIASGTVTKQVYIDTEGNASFAGKLVAPSGDIGGLTLESDKIYVGAGNFNNNDTQFYIDDTGKFSLEDQISWDPSTDTLNIAGGISAEYGTIGGWDVDTYQLDAGATSTFVSLNSNPSETYAIWAGNETAASAPFSVTKAGAIKATSGEIGGFTIAASDLTATNFKLASGSNPYLYFGSDATPVYGDEGIFAGMSSTNSKFSLVSGSTFLKYDTSSSATYDLEISGNAKVGPLYVGNAGSSTSTLTSASGLSYFTGDSVQIVNGVGFGFVTFNLTDRSGQEITGGSVTLSAYSGLLIIADITLYDGINGGGNTLGNFITDDLSTIGGTGGFIFPYNIRNVKSITIAVNSINILSTWTLPIVNISITSYKPSIQLNNFTVNSSGEITSSKLTLNSSSTIGRDTITILPASVGTTYRNIILSTPSGGLTLSRTIRLPDANGTISLLDTTQTITGAQTFRNGAGIRVEAASTQDAIVIDGRSGGTSSYAATFIPTTLSANRTITVPNLTGTINVWSLVKSDAATSISHTGTASTTTITLNGSGASIADGDLLAIEVSSVNSASQRSIVYYRVDDVSTLTTGVAGISWVNTQLAGTAGARRWYSMDLYRSGTTSLIARYCQYSGQAPGASLGSLTWTGSAPAYIWRIWKVL